MPELNGQQFSQDRMFDPGPAYANKPQAGEGVPTGQRVSVPPSHTAGQSVMQLDDPDRPSAEGFFTGRGGLVPVTESSDPNWTRSAWQIGGGHRGRHDIADEWESKPVETIPAGSEIRTNQVNTYRGETDPMVDDYHVENLSKAASFNNAAAPGMFKKQDDVKTRHPWVMETQSEQGESRRYVLEGHHRIAAMRERGTGDVQAHVMRGKPGQTVNDVLTDFNMAQYERIRQRKAAR